MDSAAPPALDETPALPGPTRPHPVGGHLSLVPDPAPAVHAVPITRRALRRLRGDDRVAFLAGHRPEAERYAGHILGLDLAGPAADLVDHALDRALRSYRRGRRQRPRPATFVGRLHDAIRVEAWRRQRRRRS